MLKASVDAIDRALTKWRGDVAGAAAELGIARTSLYERITNLHFNLDAYRQGLSGRPRGDRVRQDSLDASESSGPVSSGPSGPSTMSGGAGVAHVSQAPSGLSGKVNVQKSDAVRMQTETPVPKFPAMQTGTAAVVDEERDVPIKTEPKRERPLRLEPHLRERLQRAAWRLQAHFGQPTNENLILEQLVEEHLDIFERAKMDPEFRAALLALMATKPNVVPPPPSPRTSKKKGVGDEGGR